MAIIAAAHITIRDDTDIIIQPMAPQSPTIDMLWMDTSEELAMLYRWNGAEWILTNDLRDEIYENLDTQYIDMSSRIESTTESIMAEVSRAYAKSEDMDWVTGKVSTLLTQTADGFTLSASQIQTIRNEVAGINTELGNKLEEILMYMKFDTSGLSIGKQGNPMSVKITNERISIMQNNSEIAYFSGSKLYVKRGEFLESMKLGNFEYVPQSNGNLSFVKAVG